MDAPWRPGLCQAQVGLLFLRHCDNPAISNCTRCGRLICKVHQIVNEQGAICPECAAPQEQYDDEDGPVSGSRWRRHYYHTYNYYPYTDSDYSTFENQGAATGLAAGQGGTEAEGPDKPGDRDSAEGFMES